MSAILPPAQLSDVYVVVEPIPLSYTLDVFIFNAWVETVPTFLKYDFSSIEIIVAVKVLVYVTLELLSTLKLLIFVFGIGVKAILLIAIDQIELFLIVKSPFVALADFL